MDPLRPETAVPRIKELSKQLDRVLSDFKKATTTGKLAELEREGILVVQEMSLVAPRLHEVVMQASRSQRTAIARGLVEKPVENSLQSVKNEPTEVSQSVTATEVYTAPNQAETVIVEPKPRKKKTTKKAKK